MLDLLAGFMPEVRPLDDGATLTFLHGTISDRRHTVTAPETPMYLDAVLADTPLVGGLEPRLGDLHVRTLTILGFPSLSRPGILDALNHQDFGYRWVTRFIALDKTLATKTLTSLRRQWFNKRKSVTALLREVLYNQPAQLLDSDAENKVVDADLALQALGGDHVAFGYLTTTITVTDRSRAAVEDKVRAVERIINGLGFTCVREGVNAVEAWLSSLPGHVYASVRQPLVHTLNLAHLMPLSSVWAGPVAEHAAQDAAHAPCALVGAGRLDLAKDGERLVWRDLRDRDGSDQRTGLGEQPADFIYGHRCETISFASDEPFLGHCLESVGSGKLGGDPGALFLQRRIDPLRNVLFGFIAPDTRVREAYRWPPTEVKLLLLVQEPVVEAP